jgi:outer membrane protein TolC
MRSRFAIPLLLAACAATVEQPPEPAELAVAQRPAAPMSARDQAPLPEPAPLPPAFDRDDETRSLLLTDPTALDAEIEMARLPETAPSLPLFEALAYLRSPEVAKARERVEAARTGFAQSADLAQLIQLYRSFARELRVRVGPERSRRATASIAPSPNVEALSAEVVRAKVAIEFERLRIAVREVAAQARRAHADAVLLAEQRTILEEELALENRLVSVVRARFEAGTADQAALLAFESRRERVRTELEVLDQTDRTVRAEWNRLLHRDPEAPLALPLTGSDRSRGAAPDARTHHQELRIARFALDRARVAVRLAETMTLPRYDLGSSRLERERAGEAHAFPEPGRMMPPRADFGVREAQIQEMRARAAAAQQSLEAREARTLAGARTADAKVVRAALALRLFENEILPRSEQALEAARGSYEGNRSGYLELLDAADRLLEARLGRARAQRDYEHARAGLLSAVGAKEE